MLSRTLAFATGLMGAVIASQLPEFAQQYRQRLGGAVGELRAAMDRFDLDAGAAQVGRSDAIARLQGSPDPLVQGRGAEVNRTQARLQRLETQRDRMAAAGPVGRLALLARDHDQALLRGAVEIFEPAVPVTAEGAVAAGLGFAAFYALVRLAAAPFRRRRGRQTLRRA
ncbi:DUF2937 family protein [Alsobacter sp. KACC 23698]|uniref:DUF2937 family protein n=1 Tax=Alsobacter sp. KACC 23698 TaxID=3149229 RepID=A0AAU7JCD0_9HYPH